MFLSDILETETKVRCNSTERFTHIDLSDDDNGLQLSMPHAVAEKLHAELGLALAQLHGRQFAEGTLSRAERDAAHTERCALENAEAESQPAGA